MDRQIQHLIIDGRFLLQGGADLLPAHPNDFLHQAGFSVHRQQPSVYIDIPVDNLHDVIEKGAGIRQNILKLLLCQQGLQRGREFIFDFRDDFMHADIMGIEGFPVDQRLFGHIGNRYFLHRLPGQQFRERPPDRPFCFDHPQIRFR